MPCSYIKLPNGAVAHVRYSKRPVAKCEFCNWRPHTKLCDGPRGMTGTCDRKICDSCATHTAPDHDLCPHCVARLDKIQRGLFDHEDEPHDELG